MSIRGWNSRPLVLTAVALGSLGVLLSSPVVTSAPAGTVVGPRVEIQDVRLAGSKKGQVTLDVTWGYVEQEGLARPSEFSIIAVLIGARGKEYKAKAAVPVPPNGPLPTSFPVVVNHEEGITSPRDVRVVVTVTPRVKDGTSNTRSGKMEVTLRLVNAP
jgi:hypothetical protein